MFNSWWECDILNYFFTYWILYCYSIHSLKKKYYTIIPHCRNPMDICSCPCKIRGFSLKCHKNPWNVCASPREKIFGIFLDSMANLQLSINVRYLSVTKKPQWLSGLSTCFKITVPLSAWFDSSWDRSLCEKVCHFTCQRSAVFSRHCRFRKESWLGHKIPLLNSISQADLNYQNENNSWKGVHVYLLSLKAWNFKMGIVNYYNFFLFLLSL